MLGHGFQQCALCAWRCPVDFIGQQDGGEYRAGVELETAFFRIKNGNTENIRGQQIGRELDALEGQAQRCGQCTGQGRFAEARQVFDQQVATGQKGNERGFDGMRIAQNLPVAGGHGGLEFSADWG